MQDLAGQPLWHVPDTLGGDRWIELTDLSTCTALHSFQQSAASFFAVHLVKPEYELKLRLRLRLSLRLELSLMLVLRLNLKPKLLLTQLFQFLLSIADHLPHNHLCRASCQPPMPPFHNIEAAAQLATTWTSRLPLRVPLTCYHCHPSWRRISIASVTTTMRTTTRAVLLQTRHRTLTAVKHFFYTCKTAVLSTDLQTQAFSLALQLYKTVMQLLLLFL